jgi:hypothetical protein
MHVYHYMPVATTYYRCMDGRVLLLDNNMWCLQYHQWV